MPVYVVRLFELCLILALSLHASSASADWGNPQDQKAVEACKLDLPRNVVRYCPCIQTKLEAMNTDGRVLDADDRTQRLKTAIASCSNDALSGSDAPAAK